MVRIIINADDCGYSPEVNAAIDYALSVGAISSTTIMANSQYLDVVHQMECRYPKASFGAHLNITEGPSLTQSPVFQRRGITDEKHFFIHGNSTRCTSPDNELATAIYNEWDAQLDLLINKEHFRISHIDGHHHCHSWPGLEEILVELMKKYGLTKVRNRYKYPYLGSIERIKQILLSSSMPFRGVSPFIAKHTDNICFYKNYNRALSSNGIKTTDFFGDYEHMSKVVTSKICEGTFELMCHPGLKDYADEYQHVLNDVIGINDSNRQLISYKELI